jgi:hypothetical protein
MCTTFVKKKEDRSVSGSGSVRLLVYNDLHRVRVRRAAPNMIIEIC